MVAHGYVRFTADLDLIVDLEEQNLRRALACFGGLGYRPRAPVPLDDFADSRKRKEWVETKEMKVFSLFSSNHPATEIDLFAEMPFDFEQAYAGAARLELARGLTATFVDLDRLISLKNKAGRPRDIQDIEELESLRKDLGDA